MLVDATRDHNGPAALLARLADVRLAESAQIEVILHAA
jgi:hypothetical protein